MSSLKRLNAGKLCMTWLPNPRIATTVVGMTNDRKAIDKAINKHFMAVLAGAIKEAGFTHSQVDEKLGVAASSTNRWLRNAQVMRAPTFIAIAIAIGADPEELTARAMRRVEAAGLLDGVEVLPNVEPEQAGQ